MKLCHFNSFAIAFLKEEISIANYVQLAVR